MVWILSGGCSGRRDQEEKERRIGRDRFRELSRVSILLDGLVGGLTGGLASFIGEQGDYEAWGEQKRYSLKGQPASRAVCVGIEDIHHLKLYRESCNAKNLE